MDKNRFSRFEERVQSLVEGGFARLFAGRLQPREVALHLARAMEDNTQVDAAGHPTAPNHYLVHLHPDDHRALLAAQPDLEPILAESLIELAQESDLLLDRLPEVELVADPAVALHTVLVMADHVQEVHESTQAMVLPDDAVQPADPVRLPSAFLVLNGDHYVPLERTVVNIGRRRDNTIVLDDARVSRQHCQLRFRFGRFVLYDLGSRGGTFVNEARVSECVLRAGDVISLAGVPLVYLEDNTTAHPIRSGDTQTHLNLDDLEPPSSHEDDSW